MKLIWPKFTFHSFKYVLQLTKKVFTNGWNLLMVLALTLATIQMWNVNNDVSLATMFLGSWLIVHRYIITYKNEQIKDLMGRI